jgi:hypothetical protein
MSSVLPDRPVFALMAAKRTETRDEREARKEAKRAAQAEAALRAAAEGAVPTVTATAPEAGGGSRATEHEDGEHVGGEDEEVREVENPHGLSEVDRARIFAEEQRAAAEEAILRAEEAAALVEQEEAKARGSGAAEEKEVATARSVVRQACKLVVIEPHALLRPELFPKSYSANGWPIKFNDWRIFTGASATRASSFHWP